MSVSLNFLFNGSAFWRHSLPLDFAQCVIFAGELEDSIAGMSSLSAISAPSQGTDPSLGFQLPASAALAKCLQRVTSPSVHLTQVRGMSDG